MDLPGLKSSQEVLPYAAGGGTGNPIISSTLEAGRGGIEISLSHRWLITGTTGSGKTTFARALIKHMRKVYPGINIYILDGKGQGEFDGWGETHEGATGPPVLPPGQGKIVVWKPELDDFERYDEWFGRLHRAEGPFVFLNDELSAITKKSGDAPDNFQRLMKQGRVARKSVVNLTQELAYIPRQVVTQTTHIVRFMLLGKYDTRTGNELVRREPSAKEPPLYSFFHFRTDKPEPATLYRGVQDFF